MDGIAGTAEDENETATFSCLAITAEKRSHGQKRRTSGGCTGIFYQLFDWNRRLAKNSHKNKLNLISSGTPKNSTSKRFGAHDKLLMPPPASSKFHLIAEENGEGFPNAKKHRMDIVKHKHEMRPPSLVAKLMGLDAIPTPKKQKQTRPSPNKMNEKLVDAYSPQQDIVVGRFGQDTLHLKNVLSGSRKRLSSHKVNHHPKLPSPVKSPRVRSGKNAARLIDAATRILEPRLRVSNSRASAITYPHYLRHEMRGQSVGEGSIVKPSDLSTRSVYDSGMPSPCKNCSLPYGDIGISQVAREQQSPFQSNVRGCDSLSLQKWPLGFLLEEDIDKPPEVGRDKTGYIVLQSQDCNLTHRELGQEKRSFNSQGQKGRHFSSTPYVTEGKLPTHSSDAFSPKQQKTNKLPFDRESSPLRPTPSSLQSRRVTSAVNGITEIQETSSPTQRVSGRSKQKLQKNVNNERFPQDMKPSTSKSQPKTPERKRQIINATGKVEYCPSSLGKPGITENHRHPNRSPSSQSRSSSNSKFSYPGKRRICSEPSSFTFQSPAKYESEIIWSKDKIGSAANRVAIAEEKRTGSVPAQPIPASSDVLDTLLKQKLKELAFQDTQGAQSKTSKILQELISALANEHHMSTDLIHAEFSQKSNLHNSNVDSSFDTILHHHDHRPDTITSQKANKLTEHLSVMCLGDSDHLSPGSVLGASFSNSSCVSSSLDDYSEIILQHGLMEYPHYISPPSELGTQPKQVTSTDRRSSLDNFIKRISIMLEDLMQHCATLSSSKLGYIKEVVLHAGSVLENGSLSKAGEKHEFVICHFFDQLETFANAMRSNSKDPSAFNKCKDKTQLNESLLDLAVEYLDSRFGNNSIPIFDLRWRLPFNVSPQQLILGLNSKITQWANLAGKTPDELIEWDVSHGSGYWDGYETEASRVCCELDEEVLKTLVEEIVMDLFYFE